YVLTETDEEKLRTIADGETPESFYAKGLLTFLKGELFNPELPLFTQAMSMPVNGPNARLQQEAVGREKLQQTEVTYDFFIFPNPARGIITIEWPVADNGGNTRLTVYNGLGKLVYLKNNPTNPLTLNTDKLGKGLFVAVLEQPNKQIQSQKFIILE
ncbi:MAG: T9SS type A sorting domain-containing protein, partial [Saprospiraceae bacterium]|nr:T9SS type A sorting domain-containing protein [Saprospiraceae bacterium]